MYYDQFNIDHREVGETNMILLFEQVMWGRGGRFPRESISFKYMFSVSKLKT